MKPTSDTKNTLWKKIPNTDFDIAFWNFIPAMDSSSHSEAVLTFKKSNEEFKEPLEILTMEASFKPFISLVWIGVFVIVVGFVIAFIKNIRTKKEEILTDTEKEQENLSEGDE